MGGAAPFQLNGSKHLESRAGSGRGVHRPRCRGALCTPGEAGAVDKAPIGKVHFAPGGMSMVERDAFGPGGGMAPGQTGGEDGVSADGLAAAGDGGGDEDAAHAPLTRMMATPWRAWKIPSAAATAAWRTCTSCV